MKSRWPRIVVAFTALLVLQATAHGQAAELQRQIYPVQHVNAEEVQRMLKDLLTNQFGEKSAQVRILRNGTEQQMEVRGNESVQKLASQLIRRVDRPDIEPSRGPSTTAVKGYTVPVAELPQRLTQIRLITGEKARITSDRERGLIFVVATPAQHSAIERHLQTVNSTSTTEDASPATTADESASQLSAKQGLPQRSVSPASQPTPPTSSTASSPEASSLTGKSAQQPPEMEVADVAALFPRKTVGTQSPPEFKSVSIRLEKITAKQCLKALQRLLGDSLHEMEPGKYQYKSEPSNQNSQTAAQATLEFDETERLCRVSGQPLIVGQFSALIGRFEDSQRRGRNESYRFLPLRNVPPEVLNRAIQVWKQTQLRGLPDDAQGAAMSGNSKLRQVAFAAQQDNASNNLQPAGGPNANGDGGVADNADAPNAQLRRPSSDVTVQPLPDLDVLILRGRDPDVEELVRIIQEIERLSEETAPEIEVYFLKHVQGEVLNQLVSTVMEDLTAPLQGRISVTPLIKPNALLLIGWGEAVVAAKRLIQKLDRPVEPSTQMRVFALKHAPVSEVSTTVTEFLNGRGGLAPDVNISANSRTNSLIVNAAPRDMEEVAQLIARLDVAGSESVNRAKVVRLKNSLAADVAQTITEAITAARGGTTGRRSAAVEMLLVQPDGKKLMMSGLLDNITLTPDPRTNSIFISGPADSLPLVERLIEQLDESPAASAQIKVFQVTNSDASELVTVLRSLFPETAATSPVPQLATAEGEGSLVPVRFSVDVRTNTIIATGTTGDLQIIEALLLRLDQTESQERVNRVYRLKNSPATDVALAVNDFLRSERIVSQAAPGRMNPFQQIEQEVVVVPEPVRNSLIISATPRYFDQILELVEDLDDQPPQVMIQVILAEVDLDNFHEFGVELGLQDSLLFDRSLLGELLKTTVTTSTSTANGVVTTTADNIIGATNSPGFDFNNQPLGNSGSTQSRATAGNVAGQALSHFSLGRVNSDLEYGGMVLSASSENISVLLRALDQCGSMEVLSRPQIMTLDNQQAFIQVGQRVPRIVNSQLTQLGQINSLELEDVGLLLGVTPRISPEGQVVMEIDAEKSEVGPEREGIPISVSNDGTVIRSPRVEVTTAQTTVSAASGQTIVIGGLITNSNQSLTRKVPWLGDLPVLGNLFRFDSHSNRRTELLIILTPHVIRGQSEAEYLKQVEMSRMSWVSSDVFEWIHPEPLSCNTLDDSGVPVIFPDQQPALELKPMPEFAPPMPDSEVNPAYPVPFSESSTDIPRLPDVQQTSFEPDQNPLPKTPATTNAEPKQTASESGTHTMVYQRQTVSRRPVSESKTAEKSSRFAWPWGKK